MSQMKTPRANLDALLALLNSAAQDAIAEYQRTGDVPSKESVHPRDSQHPATALKNALRILEGACDQLCTTLAPPTHTLLSVSASSYWLYMVVDYVHMLFSADTYITSPLASDLPSRPKWLMCLSVTQTDCQSPKSP
jgi:hypothetical protein